MADIHVHVAGPVTVNVVDDGRLNEIDAKLGMLAGLLSQLVQVAVVQAQEVSEVGFDLSNIQAAVENQTTVDASVLSLAQAMAQQIRDLSDQVSQEPAVQTALNTFADQLTSAAGPVAQFVAANTPAAGGGTGGTTGTTGGTGGTGTTDTGSGTGTTPTDTGATGTPDVGATDGTGQGNARRGRA